MILYLDISRDYKGNDIPYRRRYSLTEKMFRLCLDYRIANDIAHYYNCYLVETNSVIYATKVEGFENGLMLSPYRENRFMTVHPDYGRVVLNLLGECILDKEPTHVVGLEYDNMEGNFDVPFTVRDTRERIELGFFSAEDYMKWELSK